NVIKHGTRPNRIEATGSKRVANVFDPLRPLVRDHPNAPRYNNQSRYLAGVVSGIAAQSNAVAVAEATPKIKKPSQRSRPSNIKPVTAVLIEAAMAIRVPMNPRTRLKRPVPVVRSVITRIVSTVMAAASRPARSFPHCGLGHGRLDNAAAVVRLLYVASDKHSLPAGILHESLGLLGVIVLIQIGNEHVGALARIRDGDRPANSALDVFGAGRGSHGGDGCVRPGDRSGSIALRLLTRRCSELTQSPSQRPHVAYALPQPP